MKRTLKLLLGTALALVSQPALAQDWGAATHFGYAVVDRSSTGFEEVQGSMLFFDVYRNFDSLAVGLRTVTQGGKGNSQEYYRLGAGPVVKWSYDTWTLHGSLGTFQETALGGDGSARYESRGQTFLVGWQRSRPITKGASLSWGGFVTGHQGSLTPASTAYKSSTDTNSGLSHGIEISLRMGL